jgi:hypothetical protein
VSGVNAHRWNDDDILFADLAEALGDVAPLAARVAAHGRGALAWRTVDSDLVLASLSFDSVLERSGSTRDREGDDRVLVFHAAPLAVEVEVQADRIVGQIVPPSEGEITLETVDGTRVQVDADDLGFFILPRPVASAARMRCETLTTRLVTDWFQL